MGGSSDATSLPKPADEAIAGWQATAKAFRDMVGEIQAALRAAESAHQGRAAEAATASINEIVPHAENAARTCDGIKAGLEQQVSNQSAAFNAIPAEGDKLENGRDVVIDPPQKGWVEDWGLDGNPITGWMSDYEQRQDDFRATNDRALGVMERYRAQTDGVLGGLPQFQENKSAPPPQVPVSSNMPDASAQMAGAGYSSTPSMGGSAAAGSSSAWASPSGSAPSYTPPTGGGGATPPAGSGSMWTNVPPGTQRGPDGTLYRQNSAGAWERQNPYNGNWAPAPSGGPGGSKGGAGGTAGRGGVSAGARGAVGGSAAQPGAGGRAGVGAMGGGAGATGGSGSSSSSSSARGGMMGGGAGAGAGRGQGDDEEEHNRPSWLVEAEDVFTNDMQKVAPPVLGDPGAR